MAKWKRLLIPILCVQFSGELMGDPAPPGEYEVKAAYIRNVATLIEWPGARDTSRATLHLCIVGDEPFGDALNLIRDTAADGGVWDVRVLGLSAGLNGCEMAFIARSAANDLGRILAAIGSHPVLTIGDTDGYGEKGVILNFYMDNRKVRFEINVDAARRAGFTISSQLLKLARILHSEGNHGG